jgi:hypothetical protein
MLRGCETDRPTHHPPPSWPITTPGAFPRQQTVPASVPPILLLSLLRVLCTACVDMRHASCAHVPCRDTRAPKSAQAQHSAARRRPTTCGIHVTRRGRSVAVAVGRGRGRGRTRRSRRPDSRTTNNMSVTQSHSTNIKQVQEAARGSGMLARISTRDFASFRGDYR